MQPGGLDEFFDNKGRASYQQLAAQRLGAAFVYWHAYKLAVNTMSKEAFFDALSELLSSEFKDLLGVHAAKLEVNPLEDFLQGIDVALQDINGDIVVN